MTRLATIVVLVCLLSMLFVGVVHAQEPVKMKCDSWYGCTFKVDYTGGKRYGFVGTEIYREKATPVGGRWIYAE